MVYQSKYREVHNQVGQYALLCEYDLCTGCRSCEVACKQENNLPAGVSWMQVIKLGPRYMGDKLRLDFVPTHCLHCVNPDCAKACPRLAIDKRSDGIVLVNEQLCDGCLACLDACPFSVMQLNSETGLVGMCTFCVHRLDDGQVPACVHHCQAKCLKFGPVNEVAGLKRKRAARQRLISSL